MLEVVLKLCNNVQIHIASHAHIHDLPVQMQPKRLTETVQLAQPTPFTVYTSFV